MEAVLTGEVLTRFWRGEVYKFKRIAKGEWTCIEQDSAIIPQSIIEGLPEYPLLTTHGG